MAEKKKESRVEQTNAVTRFFRETTGELRKVNWPTWPEARKLTGLVLLVLFGMAVFLGAVDALAAKLFIWILGI